jgi:hypothetical protein
MTDDERVELSAVRADLQAEEGDQPSDRGYASTQILRAIARFDRLLEGAPAHAQPPAADPVEKP